VTFNPQVPGSSPGGGTGQRHYPIGYCTQHCTQIAQNDHGKTWPVITLPCMGSVHSYQRDVKRNVCVCGAGKLHKAHPHLFTLSAFADSSLCVCGEPYRSDVHTHG
jgi:hypothetical protein